MPRKLLIGLNPEVLIWARQRSGLELEEVARALGRQVEEISHWEQGEGTPSYPQLEKLAYKIYKRPLAIFFFPEPPDEPSPRRSFRTLPDFELEQLSSEVRYLIRDGLAKQEALLQLAGPRNPIESPVFKKIKLATHLEILAAAKIVRDELGVSLEEQKGFRSTDEALKRWRLALEDHGIFVFKNSFGSMDVSGFCLYHPEYPIVYINNNSAKSRQIFTLIHELGHLLLSTSGVTKVDDSYIQDLTGENRRVEVFCNRFAGELLVPSSDAESALSRDVIDDRLVSSIATTYRVSREVVLRRALDLGFVSQSEYETRVNAWNREYLERRTSSGGGNYYSTQASYLGPSYLSLAFGRFYDGSINREQLADYLGVRETSIAGLEDRFLKSSAN